MIKLLIPSWKKTLIFIVLFLISEFIIYLLFHKDVGNITCGFCPPEDLIAGTCSYESCTDPYPIITSTSFLLRLLISYIVSCLIETYLLVKK